MLCKEISFEHRYREVSIISFCMWENCERFFARWILSEFVSVYIFDSVGICDLWLHSGFGCERLIFSARWILSGFVSVTCTRAVDFAGLCERFSARWILSRFVSVSPHDGFCRVAQIQKIVTRWNSSSVEYGETKIVEDEMIKYSTGWKVWSAVVRDENFCNCKSS